MHSKFEYSRKYLERFSGDESELLESMGNDGWELCAVVGPDSGGAKVFYFKRLRSESNG